MHLEPTSSPASLLERLAEFRFRLRGFLHFSEQAAIAAGLQPQQHQLLLQVAGTPAGVAPTIAYAAQRLGLRHNSAVELVNRCEEEGLLSRTSDAEDARRVLLHITQKGRRILNRLAEHHRDELNTMGTALIETLTLITHPETAAPASAKRPARRAER